MSFESDAAKGKVGTRKFIAPVLKKILGGSVTPTERQSNSFERWLDFNCIDGLVATAKGFLPFSARVQSGVNYKSFTIRYSRPSGTPTEYEKINKAIETDSARPFYHAQGYVSDDGQAVVAVIRTQDLFDFIKKNQSKVKIKSNDDGTKLLAARQEPTLRRLFCLILRIINALDAGETAKVQLSRTTSDGLSFGISNPISPKSTRQGRADFMKYYTTKEAAEKLGISVRTLRRWVKSGKLSRSVAGDKFFGHGDKFSAKNVRGVTNSRYERFTPEKIVKEIQIQRRLKKMIVPCDKLTGILFDYPADEYATIIADGEKCECVEGTDKKGNEVVTPYWLSLVGEYLDTKPLTPFHREVLFAAISAYEQGYRVLTFKSTLNALTCSDKNRICTKQYAAIKEAIDKLAFTLLKVDLEPLLKAYPNYKKRYTGKAELVSTLLPARYIEAEINGQKTLAVELLGESPLMIIAKMKKQVLTYDTTPLAIVGQNNTETVIVIKNYLLRRIKLMKRGLNNSIDLATIYEKCGLARATKWQKQDAQKIIRETLTHFKAKEVIQDFEFVHMGGGDISIRITP